jgi:hypothetical protein
MIIIVDPATSSTKKIKIANFLCHKLYGMFQLKDNVESDVTESLSSVVYNDSTLPTPTRLYYLRFRNEKISYNISMNLYLRGIRYILEHIPYFQILKFILRNFNLSEQHKENIWREFEDLFADENVNNFTKMEIADIFLMNGKHLRGEEMLRVLRGDNYEPRIGTRFRPDQILAELRDLEDPSEYKFDNIYNDSQNAHNTEINKSVLKVSSNLIKQEGQGDFDAEEVFNELMRISPENVDTFMKVFERLSIDTSRFTYGQNKFSMRMVVANLWSYICHSQYSTELKNRLIEEMVAMASYCTTGHLSRFVSVIQGYTNDEELLIRMSDFDSLKGKITYYLNKALENAPEDVSDSMIGSEQGIFLRYIETLMKPKAAEIFREYDPTGSGTTDVDKIILEVIQKYSGSKGWKFVDKALIYDDVDPREE